MILMICILLVFQPISLTGASDSSIFGGKVSKPHSRPYMASLQFQRHHSCGGILIREDFVLTAAHCKQPQQMTVVLGAHDISWRESSQQWIQVTETYQHPKFNGTSGNFDYDIMLLKLKKNATLNSYVKPIELPTNKKIPANVKCDVAGWGQTGPSNPLSNVLREATEKMQLSVECKKKWDKHFNCNHMICTKFNRTTGGICQGDSGGPLICDTELQGITSFFAQNGCNNSTYPHVFTKITAFLPWIKQMMQM